MLRTLVALSACLAIAFATEGTDISEPCSSSGFSCMKSNGRSFVIVRAAQSNNVPDPNAPGSIKAAWAGGMSYVDVYIFPDPTGSSPQDQIAAMLDNLEKNGLTHGQGAGHYGTVWLDIEGPQYWHSSQSENQAFFSGLVSELQAKSQVVGVYTSESQWVPIMGDWTGGSKFPLWYAHYDNNPSFSDFTAFAGWSKPSMKQYDGSVTLCGCGVDLNWYP